MFKKLFNKIKLKLMGNFIDRLIAPILQAFKAKTPKLWMLIAMVATVLQFGLSAVVSLVIPGVEIPGDFLSLQWIVTTFGIELSDKVASAILWFLALLTGSSSSAWLPPEKREGLVEESKLNAKEADVLRTALPAEEKKEKVEKVKAQRKELRRAKRKSQ